MKIALKFFENCIVGILVLLMLYLYFAPGLYHKVSETPLAYISIFGLLYASGLLFNCFSSVILRPFSVMLQSKTALESSSINQHQYLVVSSSRFAAELYWHDSKLRLTRSLFALSSIVPILHITSVRGLSSVHGAEMVTVSTVLILVTFTSYFYSIIRRQRFIKHTVQFLSGGGKKQKDEKEKKAYKQGAGNWVLQRFSEGDIVLSIPEPELTIVEKFLKERHIEISILKWSREEGVDND